MLMLIVNFKVVMGWSIGGYTSTWLAMNYPDIKGLVSTRYLPIVIYTIR